MLSGGWVGAWAGAAHGKRFSRFLERRLILKTMMKAPGVRETVR